MQQSPDAVLWPRPPSHGVALIVATIVGGLAVETLLGFAGELLADAWALAAFAWLYCRAGTTERRVLALCLLISLAGEAFLSLVWQLYDYRHGRIPLFVPPGHALLMTLGLLVARRLPPRFPAFVAIAGMAWQGTAAVLGSDSFGAPLVALFAVCCLGSRARRLYAAMFVLSLIMELYGTWLGTWTWRSAVPWVGMMTTNPPVSAGAFYCILDLLVLLALRRMSASPAAGSASSDLGPSPSSPAP